MRVEYQSLSISYSSICVKVGHLTSSASYWYMFAKVTKLEVFVLTESRSIHISRTQHKTYPCESCKLGHAFE